MFNRQRSSKGKNVEANKLVELLMMLFVTTIERQRPWRDRGKPPIYAPRPPGCGLAQPSCPSKHCQMRVLRLTMTFRPSVEILKHSVKKREQAGDRGANVEMNLPATHLPDTREVQKPTTAGRQINTTASKLANRTFRTAMPARIEEIAHLDHRLDPQYDGARTNDESRNQAPLELTASWLVFHTVRTNLAAHFHARSVSAAINTPWAEK